ncbi:MAG TPA: tetratricopeptide repeat protein [Sandaracinaceae bacterium]
MRARNATFVLALSFAANVAAASSQEAPASELRPSRLDRARALIVRGRFREAAVALRGIVGEEPALAAAWRALGVVEERLGNTDGAAEAYRRYVELAPRGADAALVRRRLARLGPDLARIRSLLLRGRFQAAVTLLRALLDGHPEHGSAWRALAVAEGRLGRPAAAAAAYRRYLELRPHAEDAAIVRSRLSRLAAR